MIFQLTKRSEAGSHALRFIVSLSDQQRNNYRKVTCASAL